MHPLARRWRSATPIGLLLLAACAAASPSEEAISPAVVAAIPLPGEVGDSHPTQLAVADGHAWIRYVGGHIVDVDLASGSITGELDAGSGEYGSIAAGEDGVWVTTFDEDTLTRVDPETHQIVATIPVGSAPEGVTVYDGSVWVSNHHGGSVSRVDPATNMVIATIPVGREGSGGPKQAVVAAGALWMSVPNSSTVVRIDPATNAVESIQVNFAENLATDGETVYCSDALGRLSQIDPASSELTRQFTPEHLPWLATLGSWWTIDGQDLLALDPENFETVEAWRISAEPVDVGDMAGADGYMWIVLADQLMLLQVDPSGG